MNTALQKLQVAITQKAFLLNRVLPSCRAAPSIQHPVWATASVNERQYRMRATAGIGRWRYLLPKRDGVKKKKEKFQMKPISPDTATAYGTLNVKVSGYDMTLVERYAQYIHNLCIRYNVKVLESFALPTKSTEVLVLPETGTKMVVDAILKTHERVVQLRSLDTTLCPVFMDVILKNQPEGVDLSVQKQTSDDYLARFKERPELEDLKSQIKNPAVLK